MKKVLSLFLVVVLALTTVISLTSTAFAAEKTKIAFVGDSITYGATLENVDTEAFASIIRDRIGADYEVGNFGKPSMSALYSSVKPYNTTEEYKNSLDFGADVLFIMLGTNDIKNENWDAGKGDFVKDYVDLINQYKKINPELKVYVGIPPRIFKENVYGERSPVILEEEGIPAIYDVAAEAGAMTINFFDPTKENPELFPDFLHPNAEGHKIFADIVYDAMFVKEYKPEVKKDETPVVEDPTPEEPVTEDPFAEIDVLAGASEWAKTEIALAHEAEILPLCVIGNYQENITRQDFCELVVMALPGNLEAGRTANFTDCDNSAVKYAYSIGVVNGISDTEFAPDAYATRQEMATMLFRAYKLIDNNAAPVNSGNYPDKDQIADWALDAVNFMNENGIMRGDAEGNIMPTKNTSREEAILLVYRGYDAIYR